VLVAQKTGESSTEDEHKDNALETRTRRGKKSKKKKKKKKKERNGERIELKKLTWTDMKKELTRVKKELKRAERQWNRTKKERRRELITQTEKARRGRLIHKIGMQVQR
jgi:hypothetical protein